MLFLESRLQQLGMCLTLISVITLGGCVSPIALDRAVIDYDKVTTDLLSKQLLLNIARAHRSQPLHFTGVTNIAATFNFQFSAGASPALTGENGALITPIFGGSVAENPTISIVPIEGEEFTRRLLTPFPENKLTLLLRQGADVDLILRLLGAELHLMEGVPAGVFANKPKDKRGYARFRQVALHLSSIQDRGHLFVEPLLFDQHWTVPISQVEPSELSALQQTYSLETKGDLVKLRKRNTGRIVLTNYDPSLLSNDERRLLHEAADQGAFNDIAFDIRAGFPGGEWPLRGFFRLRSFHSVLNFIGQAVKNDPEYAVRADPRTPYVSENPNYTLEILRTQRQSDDTDLSVNLGDEYFALKPDGGYPWNREAFRLLYQIFQMTVTDLGQQGAPGITIAK